MAKSTAIKDELALRLAKLHCIPSDKWEARHHEMLIWDYFRQAGFKPELRDKGNGPDGKPLGKETETEALSRAGREWDAFYSNARCAYASNQAKGFADAGICATPDKAEASKAEFQ